jgi:hypothetical protein
MDWFQILLSNFAFESKLRRYDVAAALDAACGGRGNARPAPTLARAAAALLARARPGGNAGTASSDGVAAPALAPDHPAFAALARVLSPGQGLTLVLKAQFEQLQDTFIC